jgi:hypothetical protein
MEKVICNNVMIKFANGMIVGPFEASTEKEISKLVKMYRKDLRSKPTIIIRCHDTNYFDINVKTQYGLSKPECD